MAQFSTLWHEVRKSIGDRTDLDTEIKSAVNDAVVDIGMIFRIRELVSRATFATEEGLNRYALDDNVLDVITARNDTDTIPLVKGDRHEYDSLDYGNSAKYGTPRKWFVDGNDLVIYASTPDVSGYTVSYRFLLRKPAMVEDTDSFPLPRQWERPTKLLAKSYVLEILGQSDEAVAAYQQMMATVGARKSVGYWEKIHSQTASVDFGIHYLGDDV